MGIMEDSRKTKTELRAEVARLRTQVEKLQKRESARQTEECARAQFLAMLAHDIKKPLGAILACAEMVQDGVKAHGLTEEEDLLERLRGSVTTIDSLVTNYLDFSRIEAGLLALVLGPLPVDRLLQRMRRHYSAEARRRRLQLEVAAAPDALIVDGDMLALERVLINLVHNALKFTPAGGTIRVHADRQDGMAVITVQDTGPGIAAEDHPFLFEKYHHPTPSRQHEGTGLGLAIVKALVEAHHGRVAVDSPPGRGACFTLHLPLWKESGEDTSVSLSGAPSLRHESH